MAHCPVCSEPLPQGTGKAGVTRRPGETVEGVRCLGCGLFIVPAEAEIGETFITVAQRAPGTMVAHFSLLRQLGRGAFGEVWLADDTSLGRKVALGDEDIWDCVFSIFEESVGVSRRRTHATPTRTNRRPVGSD